MSDVLVRVEGTAGRITLNRPRALNALTLPMLQAIDAALASWAQDPAVHLVVLDGAGERGLCAGGDIRALYDAVLQDDMSVPEDFFRAEYRLNARIARTGKPYVALMDGIVMGGGIGVAAHGTHRVVTERSRLAMPEVGIGFVPDVGGTWLLGTAPDGLGVHAALTGGQMGAADAMLCGLADIFVPSSRLADLTASLATCHDRDGIDAAMRAHAAPPPDGRLAQARGWIAPCFSHDSVEAICEALARHPDGAAQATAREIAGKSPTSLKVALRALRAAPGLGRLEPCLEQEYRLALACMSGHDFREGVRAAIVDKDRTPAWSPATLAEVTPALVEAIFAAPDHGGLGLVEVGPQGVDHANFPMAHFGVVGAEPVDWRAFEEVDPDDEALAETPPEVIMMLGFDPKDLDD